MNAPKNIRLTSKEAARSDAGLAIISRPQATRWLRSGGSPFVLGYCTPNSCPLKKNV